MTVLTYDTDIFTTITGRRVHVMSPRPEDINLEDISHGLARACRFGGHVPLHLSVAQHSVLVSHVLDCDLGKDHTLQMIGLLHDATEAYIGDMIQALKRNLPEYKAVERQWALAIGQAVGLDDLLADLPPVVKVADEMAFHAEWRDNFPDRPPVAGAKATLHPALGEPFAVAKANFQQRYKLLARALGGRFLTMLPSTW